MPYTAPTPDDLQAAFPAFSDVADPTVQFWLARAARSVDAGWTDGDRSFGVMLLACHLMTEQGLGTGAEAQMAAAGAAGFKSMRSGALSLERGDSGETAGIYGGTQYGRQFAVLLRQNRGGPLLTATGTLPTGCYPGYPHGAA